MTAIAAPASKASGAVGFAAVSALGIVYGDLGTSPLYTMQTVVEALGGHATPEAALGVLSLIVWTLLITISLKYCFFVMRADNHGEGGIMALMSLVGVNGWRRGAYIGAAMGLLGAALIYGDGIITPAISVLSALEGVNIATTSLKPYVLPLAVGILVALFAVQRLGTAEIGKAFGPIMLIWFIVIGAMGLIGVIHHPAVIAALNPLHGLRLIVTSGPTALLILGGVFLCATGGEALYADMGHFGARPIRLAWYCIVLPSLILSYAGQAGQLMDGAPKDANPFFLQAPAWALFPLVALATAATIIASQAIITGSFSMTRQAMQLGWLPGLQIRQTSDKIYGQIYVPVVNILMAAGTIAITLSFRSSDRLAGAFGTAVSTTMVLTTLLLFRAMRVTWRWPLWAVIPIAALFLTVDVGFFIANLAKIMDGGWIPLTLGFVIFGIMVTWRTGIQDLAARLRELAQAPASFFARLKDEAVPRVPGTAVYLTRTTDGIPAFITEFVKNMGSLHAHTILTHVEFLEVPRASPEEKAEVVSIGEGLYRATLRYGFIEIPNIVADLEALPALSPCFGVNRAVYFGARDIVDVNTRGVRILSRIRLAVFAFLYRNAARASDRFILPMDRTLEFTRHVKL